MRNLIQNLFTKLRIRRKERSDVEFRDKVSKAIDITFSEYKSTFDDLAEYDKGTL